MKRVFALVLQGLGTALPLGLTISAIVWLITTLEDLTRHVLLLLLPESTYFPGLGLATAVVALFGIGLLMNLYGMRHLVQFGAHLVQKIPLAKSIYAAIKDMVTFFQLGKNNELKSVVSVDMGNNVHQIGFITGEATGKRLFPGENKVGVYLPMSYQIGGFTMYLERDRLTPLDLGVEEAMRLTLTGGVQSQLPPDSGA